MSVKGILFTFLIAIACGLTSEARAQGSGSPEADELDVKAVALYREGKTSDALAAAKRAVGLRAALNENDSRAVQSLYNLGMIYRDTFDFDSALKTFQKALDISQSIGPSNSSTATILERMGTVYHFKRNDLAAIDSYKKALSITEKVSGEQHPDTARIALSLALLNIATGQYEDAQRLFERLDRSRSSLSNDQQKQQDKEIQYFACELRGLGKAADADKLEDRLSIVKVIGKSDAKASGSDTDAINGRAVHLGVPPFPPVARGAHASGTVKVHVIIDETGRPIFACVISGHPLLQDAARKAALESRFTPTIRNGKPVTVAGMIIYNFVVQ